MRASFPAAVRYAILGSIVALVLGCASACEALAAPPCGGRVVTLAGLNWESGEFLTALTREMLERGFGCRTETIPGNTVTLEQALANDDVQIIAEEWVDRSEVWRRALKAGKVRAVGHPFAGGGEGWAVPDYVVHGDAARHIAATAPDLARVDQLADPKYMALFRDPEQPGRGRFLNCPSGWTCEDENTVKLRAYGLGEKYVDFRPGTGAAMDAAITAAEAQGRPLLFYYWSPSTIAGKFRLSHLAESPYGPACWTRMHAMTTPGGGGCASPPGTIAFGVSPRFATAAPEIVAFLARATLSPDILNRNLAGMSRDQREPRAQATRFLRGEPEVWRAWVTPAIAARISASLTAAPVAAAPTPFPARLVVSIRGPVNATVAALVAHDGGVFRAISQALLRVIVALDGVFDLTPWWLLIGVLMALAWAGTRRVWLSVVIGALMFGVGVLGLWALMLQTLTLMLIASVLALAIGLPTGLCVAKSRWTRRIVSPLLDVMQTMPSFVYLIPALMLFGLGKVPAILATVIYAVPPMIRLTALGVEQVDPEVREAATSFGVSPMRLLLTVELPLALPSAMAGVNQTIMLALSMVVVASMIGARGLGEQVLNGIQMLDVGQGLEAGLGIVALAVVLDRITQGFGARRPA